MKNPLYAFLALGLTMCCLTSCIGDDDDNTSSSDKCYISSFTLGQMKRVMHATGSDGQDSTYYVSYSGSYYKMTIDQRKLLITNTDSLPLGTRVEAVLATLSYTGYVIYAESKDAEDWTSYSTSDSIDFSKPLIFRVYAENLSSYRDYTVKLNVRKTDPKAYNWTSQAALPFAAGSEDDCSLLLTASQPVAFALEASSGKVYVMKPNAEGWSKEECTGLGTMPAVRSIQYFEGKFWMSCHQSLYSSDNAVDWTQVSLPADITLIRLVASSSSALYASVEGADGLPTIASTTDGIAWTTMKVEAGGFTGEPLAATAYEQTNGNRRVVMADRTGSGTEPLTIWNLLEGYDEPWTLFGQAGDNDFLLPAMNDLCILPVNESLMAVGGTHVGGEASTALQSIYVSYDNGITWKIDEDHKLPTAAQGTTASVAAATDGKSLWLMAGDQLWCTRLNDAAQ